MARSSRGQMAAHRVAMVEVASVLVRERAVAGLSIDEVCGRAGLTRGAFYKHFDSRTALLIEALACARAERRTATDALLAQAGPNAREELVRAYLAPEHRDDPSHGCCVAALAGETDMDAELRHEYQGAVQDLLDALARSGANPEATDGESPNTREAGGCIADLSLMVGGLILARTVADPSMADAIIVETEERLEKLS